MVRPNLEQQVVADDVDYVAAKPGLELVAEVGNILIK